MINVECSTCGHHVNVPDEYSGKRIKCPKCKAAVTVKHPELAGIKLETGFDPLAELAAASDPTQAPPAAPSPPPAAPQQSTHRRIFSTIRVPDYAWLNVVASVYVVLGGIGIVIGIVLLVLTIGLMIAAWNTGGRVSGSVESFAATVAAMMWGVVMMAIGQALSAFRDMARNSWRIHDIAEAMKSSQ